MGLSKKKAEGFAIAHGLYCSRSLVVGPPCLFSLSNPEAFFLHSFCGSLRVRKRPPFRPGRSLRFWRLASTHNGWSYLESINEWMNEWFVTPMGSRTRWSKERGGVQIPGRSRMRRESHVRFLWEGCDTTTYQARRAVHGAASLLTRSMHIALSRRLAAYPRSSHFQEDPLFDLV